METYNVIMMLAVWTLCLWVYFDGYKKIKTYIKKKKPTKRKQNQTNNSRLPKRTTK